MSLVLELGQDWKKVAEKMGLKNQKEALLEFMRIKTPEICQPNLYLQKEETNTLKVPS